MSTKHSSQLTSTLASFFEEGRVCLFAGAGVGQKAGLPSWQAYLEHLADVAGRYEIETKTIMYKRISTGHFLEAAEYFKKCIYLPESIKYQELASPFVNNRNYMPSNLLSLMALPFSAVVTTNYDRSIHDAYHLLMDKNQSGLSLKAPFCVELGDLSLQQAIYYSDFFIARIHGRAEIPVTIILDNADYASLDQNPSYQDFLVHVLKSYRCLFIGYSFLDPAITKILKKMDDTLPKPLPSVHMAIVPFTDPPTLKAHLAKFNIEVVEYDPTDKHRNLWDSITSAQRPIRSYPRSSPDKFQAIPGLSKFLATCYSSASLGKEVEPLREIAVEGIVSQIIYDNANSGVLLSDINRTIKSYITLNDIQIQRLTINALGGLQSKNLCVNIDNKYFPVIDKNSTYDDAMDVLLNGVENRLKVREGINSDAKLRDQLVEIINRLLIARGWDLGAHFAGGGHTNNFDAWEQIQDEIKRHASHVLPPKAEAIANSLLDLFRHPEDGEAIILADMGRISFAIALVVNNSRTVNEKFNLLPDYIYLDSNVLMPSIVDGHPYSPVYNDAVLRMQQVAHSAGNQVNILVSTPFLNEIMSHRARAIEEIRSQQLEKIENLRKFIMMFGAENLNVFIGAYSSWVGRGETPIKFNDFLKKAAPYSTESELIAYLKNRGIIATKLSFSSGKELKCFEEIKLSLQLAYEENQYLFPTSVKASILIDHEAAQLARLITDVENGKKPMFVTADKRLMKLCSGEILGRCQNAMVSHLGFVQLIDLILGMNTDKRALNRLTWSVKLSEEKVTIRNYLIDRALQHRDEAISMAMPRLVEKISEMAELEAKAENISLQVSSVDNNNRARTAAFLDRVEQDFFKNMAEIIREKEAQQNLGFPPKQSSARKTNGYPAVR